MRTRPPITRFADAPAPLAGVVPRASGPKSRYADLNAPRARSLRKPVSGTMHSLSPGVPRRVLTTPWGECPVCDIPALMQWEGDIEGLLTFHEQVHRAATSTHVVASGRLEGDVIWRGRAGIVSGRFTSNCRAEHASPIGVSCDGELTLTGSGGLQGVQFHVTWEPDWYPLRYSGWAIAR
jgi:hypothetical protein